MTMSEVGRPGQLVDPINGGDVAADGTLLSVAEIQQRFREERARRGLAVAPTPVQTRPTRPAAPAPRPATVVSVAKTAPVASATEVSTKPAAEVPTPEPAPAAPEPVTPPAAPVTAAPVTASPVTTPVTSAGRASSQPDAGSARGALEIPAGWVRVLAGHSGAGSSTVALALADAAAAAGRPSQVIEAAAPSRSGLVSAASRELDVDESGAWRRGTRPHAATSVAVTITRRAEDRQPSGWPTTQTAGELLVAVDLGLVPTDALASTTGGPVVVVCRATIPGVRLTEQLLERLGDTTVVVAMLGGRRWPGEVTASAGPRLRALRDAELVVTVALDGHLAVTGPTHVPLPKAVLAGGRALLGLIDAAHPGGVSAPPTPAQTAPRQKGTTR